MAWFNTLWGHDYMGIGMWPAQIVEADGVPRGFGHEEIWQSLKVRDDLFLQHILNHTDTGESRLRAIDLGGGRGGLSRNIALKLKALGKLDHITCLNIAEEENILNAIRKKE